MSNLTLIPGSASTARTVSKCGACGDRLTPGRSYQLATEPDGRLRPVCNGCGTKLAGGSTECPRSGHTGALLTKSIATYKPQPITTNTTETERNGVSWTIDALELTWKALPSRSVMELFTPIGSTLEDWSPLPTGRNGYRAGMIRGLIRVYFDGGEGMGVHAEFSGQACRQLEAEGQVDLAGEGWEGFLKVIQATEASASRIDVATDDRAGMLEPEKIEGAVSQSGPFALVTRFRYSPQIVKTDLRTGAPATGWSRYFGVGKSRIRVRMYDKQAETIEKGGTDPGAWMRVEMQARDERADWLLGQVVEGGGKAIAAAILNYLDFKVTDDSDTNRTRWATADWWFAFLGTLEKIRATGTGVVRSVEQTANWIERQVSPALAFLLHAPDFGLAQLLDFAARGTLRLQPWQLQSLAAMGVEIDGRDLKTPAAEAQTAVRAFLGLDLDTPAVTPAFQPTPGLGFGML